MNNFLETLYVFPTHEQGQNMVMWHVLICSVYCPKSSTDYTQLISGGRGLVNLYINDIRGNIKELNYWEVIELYQDPLVIDFHSTFVSFS